MADEVGFWKSFIAFKHNDELHHFTFFLYKTSIQCLMYNAFVFAILRTLS